MNNKKQRGTAASARTVVPHNTVSVVFQPSSMEWNRNYRKLTSLIIKRERKKTRKRIVPVTGLGRERREREKKKRRKI